LRPTACAEPAPMGKAGWFSAVVLREPLGFRLAEQPAPAATMTSASRAAWPDLQTLDSLVIPIT
jgi:hypothetical protein